MKNKQMLEEGKEALQRTLLMMKYDMKKTLTENVEVISEDEARSGVGFGAPQFGAPQFSSDPTKNLEALKALEAQVAQEKIKNNPYYTGVFSCLPKQGNSSEGTFQGQKVIRYTNPTSLEVWWEDNHYTKYSYNSETKKSGAEVKRGNFKCTGTVLTDTTKTNVEKQNVQKQNVQKQKTPSITDKNVLNTLKFDFQYPGDKSYSYAFVPGTVAEAASTQNGTWYAKNNKTGKVFDISKNYPQTAQKLSTQFPNGDKAGTQTPEISGTTQTPETSGTTQTPETSGTTQTSTEPKKMTDMPSIELSIMKKNNPLEFKVGYNKLGSLEKKMVDDKMKGMKTESLKKSLKKNLLEVKEKKQDLLIESNIIRKRFEMIGEGRDLNIDTDIDYIVESLFAEISYLKRQGYNTTLINEESIGIFGWLGSLLGGTATEVPDVIKEYVSSWLLKKMGVSADSYFGNVIVTLIGDLSFSDYDKFFSDCRFASNKVSDALINGYLRQLQEENDSTSGAGGFVISAIRNAIVTYFADSKDSLIQKLEDEVINFLCPILSKLTGVMGDKVSDMKQKVMS